jgi:hypothetical protein
MSNSKISCHNEFHVRASPLKLVEKHPQCKETPFANANEIPPINNRHKPINKRELVCTHIPVIIRIPTRSSKYGSQIAEMLIKDHGKIS